MKRLVKHTFHSNLLIPRKVVQDAQAIGSPEAEVESILLWIDAHQSNHFLRSGDEVYHKENLEQLMYVDRIIRKTYGEESKKRQKIVGVDVHFWENLPDEKFV